MSAGFEEGILSYVNSKTSEIVTKLSSFRLSQLFFGNVSLKIRYSINAKAESKCITL